MSFTGSVALCCFDDYSNFMYQLEQALLSIGVNAKGFKLVNHPFGYPNQCELIHPDLMNDAIKDFDIVIACHSFISPLIHSKVIPYHTGTAFRQNPDYYNELFKESPFSLIALPEFNLTAKNPKYLVGCVDTDSIKPTKQINEVLTFGHFPPNHLVKGTSTINKVLNETGVNYISDSNLVSYSENLKRLDSCDIIIELFADGQGGKPYGSFGMTALEAAALGKIVITQNNSGQELYNDTYGFCPLNFVKDENKLISTIKTLDNYQGEYIKGQQDQTREWVVKNHSYKATAEKLISYL